MVDTGEEAPDFTLRATRGTTFSLRSLRCSKRALLIFYPRALTGGWADPLSAVRGSVAELRALDVEPYAIHPDDALSAPVFLASLEVPFPVLVDTDRAIATAYGAITSDGTAVTRTTVVVGKDGRVLYRAIGATVPEQLLAVMRDAAGADEITPAWAVPSPSSVVPPMSALLPCRWYRW